MKVKVTRYHEHEAGSLRAFVDFELEDVGLTIPNCSLLESKNGLWIALPQDEYMVREGGQQVKKYKNKVFFDPKTKKDKYDEWQEAALQAVLKYQEGDAEGDDSGF